MSFQNLDVLDFYRDLPFNYYNDKKIALASIKKDDPINIYPVLKNVLDTFDYLNVLEIGSGVGWMSNSLNYHHHDKLLSTGIDFNSVATDYSKEVAESLNIKSNFITSDLFKFQSDIKYELLLSLGVLHHTNNCEAAIRHVCKLGKDKSFFLLGLYHKYGRAPFLEYFDNMKEKDEDYKFNKYKELHTTQDEKHLYSWFRDQVLHPHETQHTLKEIVPILESENFKIVSTSINRFDSIKDINNLYNLEKNYYKYAEEKIVKKEYFPGFFIILAEKING